MNSRQFGWVGGLGDNKSLWLRNNCRSHDSNRHLRILVLEELASYLVRML